MKKFGLVLFALASFAFAEEMAAEFRLQSGAIKQGKVISYTVDSVTVLGQFGGMEQVKVFPRSMFASIVLADGSLLPAAPAEAEVPAVDSSFVAVDSTQDTLAAVQDTTPAQPLPLAPEPEPEPTPVVAQDALPALPPLPGLRTTQKVAIALWGATAASLATGVVFNVMANQDIEDYDNAYDRRDISAMDKAESDQSSHIKGRNISYGISLGTLLVGGILWFL